MACIVRVPQAGLDAGPRAGSSRPACSAATCRTGSTMDGSSARRQHLDEPRRAPAPSRPLTAPPPQGPPAQAQAATEAAVAAECDVETVQARPQRIGWARLLKRDLRHRHAALPELRRRARSRSLPTSTCGGSHI